MRHGLCVSLRISERCVTPCRGGVTSLSFTPRNGGVTDFFLSPSKRGVVSEGNMAS